MESFVPRNKFVGECEAWHQGPLFEPEDGTEAAGEEDSFDGCKCHQSLMETHLTIDPLHGPFGFFSDDWHIGNSIEKVGLFGFILDVCIDQKTVCLRMNVFHCYLKTVEAPRLRNLNLCAELLS